MIKLEQLVLASHNAGKLKELQAMLGAHVKVRSIGEFSDVEPEETGLSFVENAILKARNAARISGLPALADDSGLAVDFLGGAPGIYSARYADGKGDAANNAKLLDAMKDVPDEQRGLHRTRMKLILTVPALQGYSMVMYEDWRRVVAQFEDRHHVVGDRELGRGGGVVFQLD